MGGKFSAPEYVKQIDSYAEGELVLTTDSIKELDLFFQMSENFGNVFGESTLAQYRNMKTKKPENLIFMISEACKVMYDCALEPGNMTAGDAKSTTLQGAVNFMARVFPLLSEDKAFASKCMWREQAAFNNQVNALNLLQSIPLLFFKPGYTIAPLE